MACSNRISSDVLAFLRWWVLWCDASWPQVSWCPCRSGPPLTPQHRESMHPSPCELVGIVRRPLLHPLLHLQETVMGGWRHGGVPVVSWSSVSMGSASSSSSSSSAQQHAHAPNTQTIKTLTRECDMYRAGYMAYSKDCDSWWARSMGTVDGSLHMDS